MKHLLTLFLLATITLTAQNWQPNVTENGNTISFANGAAIVKNYPAKTTLDMRFDKFMHGIVDQKTTICPWQALNVPEKYLDENSRLDAIVKTSTLAAVRLAGGERLQIQAPLISGETLYKKRGSTFRIFCWIKGDETGKDMSLWDGAPQLNLYLMGNNGRIQQKITPMFKTRGSYPWFCYHIDITVPYTYAKPIQVKSDQASTTENKPKEEDLLLSDELLQADTEISTAEFSKFPARPGLYLELTNPASGTAWFSTLSWKIITSSERFEATRDRRFHPTLASLAPNAARDELPMHLYYGLPSNSLWPWVKGTAVVPDMTRIQNLKKILVYAQGDWAYMTYAVPYLLSLARNGRILKTQPDFEKGWEDELMNTLRKMQDPATGFWVVNGKPNLYATWAIACNCYSSSAERQPSPPSPTPWLAWKSETLPRPDAIIDTLLNQCQLEKERYTGWSDLIFQDETDLKKNPCDLTTTALATGLLSKAMRLTRNADLAAKAQGGLRDVRNHALNNMIAQNGIWLAHSTDIIPTQKELFFYFLENSGWLDITESNIRFPEHNFSKTIVDTADNKIVLRCSWPKNAVSIRIFLAPKSLPNNQLQSKHLLAILLKKNLPKSPAILQEEPFLAARWLVQASQNYWNYTPVQDNALFYQRQMQEIPSSLLISSQYKQVEIPLVQLDEEQTIRIAIVNHQGVMSRIHTRPEVVPAKNGPAEAEPEKAPEEAKNTQQAKPAGNVKK